MIGYPVGLFPGDEVGNHGFTETVFIMPQPVIFHGRIRGNKKLVMHVLQLTIVHPTDQSNVNRLCYLFYKGICRLLIFLFFQIKTYLIKISFMGTL